MGKTPAQEMARKLKATKVKIAAENKKNKVQEDKAFGLKNQKGAKQALNVDRLRMAAARQGKTDKEIREEQERNRIRNEKRKMQRLGVSEDELLTGKKVGLKVEQIAAGVDPKTVLCGYFKAGKCRAGKKCKFSHDLDIERKKKEKKSLYADKRAEDTMDKWDQEKLEMVVKQKHLAKPNATKIVCKYFIEAIETKKYGWFWKCENGEDCMYQHQLPPGFVLKSDLAKEKKEDEVSIIEQIEIERKKLDLTKCTAVTPETFAAWKIRQKEKKLEEAKEVIKAEQKKSKRLRNGMTGRSLFIYKPELFKDDDDAAETKDYDEEEEDEEGKAEEDATKTKEWTAKEEPAVIDEDLFLEDAALPDADVNDAADSVAALAVTEPAAAPAAAAPAPAAAPTPAAPAKKEPKVKLTKAEKAAKKAQEKIERAAAKKAEAKAKAEKEAAEKKAALLAKRLAAGEDVCMCRGTYVCANCMAAES